MHTMANHPKAEETVIADHEIGEKPYRPARWQSNLTILSCVCPQMTIILY